MEGGRGRGMVEEGSEVLYLSHCVDGVIFLRWLVLEEREAGVVKIKSFAQDLWNLSWLLDN